ncbi:hypothetical protein AWH69_11525 [Janibacter melonis]|uniref:Uncharacterized protein n=1 Tax=Janibacter melonis TaxID=262209 RepID=A0A176QBI4_9MICO|nr:hypothetical protein [Janibacter melonis]OAB87008.1 hypothetical protein AWH69_11525 [Janibacter melonis]
MKLYADLPARRTAQVVSDLLMIAWVWGWVWAGRTVHDVTMRLAEPGRRLEGAGSGFREKMTSAGNGVDDLPLVDDKVATPFREAAGAGTDIESAGRDLVDAVERLSTALGLVTAVVPIVLVLLVWGTLRYRFVRHATAAQRFMDSDADLDLFALRAMAGQPMPRLAAISPDPVGAWRRRDPDVVRALALLELRDAGLRPPRPTGTDSLS